MIFKKVLLVFLCFTTLVCQAQQEKKKIVFKVRKPTKKEVVKIESNNDEITKSEGATHTFVEEPATFQGGNENDFKNWVQSNVVCPASAAEAKISGKVLVRFLVNSQGKVIDAKIITGISKDIDKEVLRVILSSPTWVPGKLSGKAVKQLFVIPIIIKS